MQQEYLQLLKPKIEADGRIGAAWLEGSFGRGNADRYSDLDIHLLLPEHGLTDFQADVEAWLSSIRPLALFNRMFDGKMVNALTHDGLRLDVWLHPGESITLEQGKTLVLFDTDGRIRFDKTPQPADPATVAAALERQTREFWRCIALLPSVLGRNELIAGFMGLVVEVNLLTEILIAGHGIRRDRGVKNLITSCRPTRAERLKMPCLWIDSQRQAWPKRISGWPDLSSSTSLQSLKGINMRIPPSSKASS